MAEIQDIDSNDELNTETDELGEIEAVEQAQKESSTEIPDQYRGKSVEELVKMHQEAQKLIGRHSQEVGEVRKLADELIRSQLSTKPKAEEKSDEIDFFENPQEAIKKALENDPRLRTAEQNAMLMRQEMAKQQLITKHPDFGKLVNDPEFRQWVGASKVRTKLAQDADNYDVDAADELLSTYKELKQVRVVKSTEEDKKVREKTLKTVAVDSGGSGESTRKIFRRAELIQLKLRDPQGFAARQAEFDLAYQEGRVR